MRRLFFLTAVVASVAACATKPTPDEPVTEQTVSQPTAEQVATTPCGNPDWTRLPPGSEKPASEQVAEPPAAE